MAMAEDNSDYDLSGLVRINSGPRLFSRVPGDMDFIFKDKISPDSDSKPPFIYTLKEGRILPYVTEIAGTKTIF